MTMIEEFTMSPSNTTNEVDLQLDSTIKRNLCMVHVCTKRWTGRVRSKNAKIEVPSDDNMIIEIDGGKMTKPCHILDDHEIFKEIDAIGKLKDNILLRYTVSADEKGFHLVSMSKVGKMIAELIDIREQRQTVIREKLMPQWDFEIADHIRAKFPDHHKIILSHMPRVDRLLEKFDITWTVRPLTPFTGEDLDLTEVNPEDRWRVIEESNRILNQKAMEQVQSIYDTVFGEVVTLCEQINDGSIETGKRRGGALVDMLSLLERLENFGHETTPEILEQVRTARQTISRYNIKQVNSDSSVQNAIKNAMLPLGDALKNLQDQHRDAAAGRSARSIVL